MEAIYKLTAYNTEAQYAYGTESEVAEYCNQLNAAREINHWEYEVVEMSDDEAEALCFNLAEALIA